MTISTQWLIAHIEECLYYINCSVFQSVTLPRVGKFRTGSGYIGTGVVGVQSPDTGSSPCPACIHETPSCLRSNSKVLFHHLNWLFGHASCLLRRLWRLLPSRRTKILAFRIRMQRAVLDRWPFHMYFQHSPSTSLPHEGSTVPPSPQHVSVEVRLLIGRFWRLHPSSCTSQGQTWTALDSWIDDR